MCVCARVCAYVCVCACVRARAKQLLVLGVRAPVVQGSACSACALKTYLLPVWVRARACACACVRVCACVCARALMREEDLLVGEFEEAAGREHHRVQLLRL